MTRYRRAGREWFERVKGRSAQGAQKRWKSAKSEMDIGCIHEHWQNEHQSQTCLPWIGGKESLQSKVNRSTPEH
ncbi:unnamed protein product [Pleuronectes platessa]|uniref:Uncharacterized protein n=1 Tax=Pleuronectes platessa TaxID=8262 RepID=A0A9N7U892_PLEPL|nr:unnamed protein product [Pleuronectes platessa]